MTQIIGGPYNGKDVPMPEIEGQRKNISFGEPIWGYATYEFGTRDDVTGYHFLEVISVEAAAESEDSMHLIVRVD